MISNLWRRMLAHRDLFIVLAIVIGLSGANLLWTAHQVRSTSAQFAEQESAARRQQATQQAAQQRIAAAELKALCTDVGSMSLIPPPPGNPATNPSRGYEQAEHRTWQGLYTSIRCAEGSGK